MLIISNGWLSNTISPTRITRVATAALQNARTGGADNSRDMARVERFVDYVFCGSVKKQYMDYLYQMAQNRAWLEQELEKPEPRRVSTRLVQCRNAISRNQESIKNLMSGNTLEFGHEVFAEFGHIDNFLIFRDRSRAKTIGISAQSPSPLPQPTPGIIPVPPILNVTKVEDIRVQDLVNIQRREQLRCQGRTYLVKFTDNNEPIVMRSVKYPQAEFELIQQKLTDLWSVDMEKSRFTQAPTFESPMAVHEEDLNSIRTSRKIRCIGTEFQVRVRHLNEPTVLYSIRDLFGRAIQATLTSLWVVEQADCCLGELERLEKFDGSLTLPSISPELVTGQNRTSAEMEVLNEWVPVSRDAANNLKALAELFDEQLAEEKGALKKTLEALSGHSVDFYEQRNILLQTRSEMHSFANKQESMRQYIHDLRQLYCRLYFLARNSDTSEMRALLKTRIERFNECLKCYLASGMEEEAIVTFNRIKNAMEEFVRDFDSTQLLRCTNLFDPPPVIVKPWKVIQPPKSAGAQEALKDLLRKPNSSWEQVATAMKTLASRQNVLLATFVLRHELTTTVTSNFQSFLGLNGEGLDPDTGKSFYTPETFARIISLKEIRHELMDTTSPLTLPALREMEGIMKGHITAIRKETTQIKNNEQRPWPFRSKSSMHLPEKMAGTGEYLCHIQWKNLQADKAIELDPDRYFARKFWMQ